MDRQLVNPPGMWCANFNALELVFGRYALLCQLAQLCSNIGKLLSDLRLEVLLDLRNLQLCFDRFCLCL